MYPRGSAWLVQYECARRPRFQVDLSTVAELRQKSHAEKRNLQATASAAKQIPHCIIIHSHMQVRRRDADVGMAGGVADFGQCATAGQCVADEGMAAVVNGLTGFDFLYQGL